MGLVFPWCEEGSFPSWDDLLDEARGIISGDREASCTGAMLRCSCNRPGSRLGGEDILKDPGKDSKKGGKGGQVERIVTNEGTANGIRQSPGKAGYKDRRYRGGYDRLRVSREVARGVSTDERGDWRSHRPTLGPVGIRGGSGERG